jgi:hypothetical protein
MAMPASPTSTKSGTSPEWPEEPIPDARQTEWRCGETVISTNQEFGLDGFSENTISSSNLPPGPFVFQHSDDSATLNGKECDKAE